MAQGAHLLSVWVCAFVTSPECNLIADNRNAGRTTNATKCRSACLDDDAIRKDKLLASAFLDELTKHRSRFQCALNIIKRYFCSTLSCAISSTTPFSPLASLCSHRPA